MRDYVLTCDDDAKTRYDFNNFSTQKWLEGHESGAVAVVQFLKDMALKEFMEKRDKQATFLRDLADEILREVCPKLRKNAEKHEKDFPSELGPDDNI